MALSRPFILKSAELGLLHEFCYAILKRANQCDSFEHQQVFSCAIQVTTDSTLLYEPLCSKSYGRSCVGVEGGCHHKPGCQWATGSRLLTQRLRTTKRRCPMCAADG